MMLFCSLSATLFFLYGGVNQYARLLGLFAMQGNTHFKNKIKTFNAYTTYVKEVKNCRLSIRHFRPVKKRAKAKKALTRLRTIANKLIRELQRKLPTRRLMILMASLASVG
jgi:hypothetical protein